MAQSEGEKIQYEYLKERLENQEAKIKVLESMAVEMTKIATILEIQQAMSKEQDRVLKDISQNLSEINHKSDRLNERVDHLESEVKEHSDSNTINVGELTKKIGWTVVSLVIGGIITAIMSGVF